MITVHNQKGREGPGALMNEQYVVEREHLPAEGTLVLGVPGRGGRAKEPTQKCGLRNEPAHHPAPHSSAAGRGTTGPWSPETACWLQLSFPFLL